MPTGRLQSYDCIVTGGCGFLGRHLIRKLLADGARVVALDQSPDILRLPEGMSKALRVVQTSLDEVPDEDILNGVKSESSICFHLAGMSGVASCNEEPLRAYRSNVGITASMLEFCRRAGIGTFVFPSSGLVYGTSRNRGAMEQETVPPYNMYTATKLAAEDLVRGYQSLSGGKGLIVRLSNVYGPGMAEKTVIGTMLCQARRGERLALRDLSEVRDFIYVEDTVEAMIRLSLSLPANSTTCVNVSTGVGTSIGQAAQVLTEIACLQVPAALTVPHAPADQKPSSSSILDNSELIKRTSWKPESTLSEGLALTL